MDAISDVRAQAVVGVIDHSHASIPQSSHTKSQRAGCDSRGIKNMTKDSHQELSRVVHFVVAEWFRQTPEDLVQH